MLNHYLTNTLSYNPAKCINCGMCLAVCPHGVFGPNGKVVSVVRAQDCMECGACQVNCPTQAIAVESGVGCAAAMIQSAILGRKEVTCGCDEGGAGCCGEADSGPRPGQATRRQGRFSWLTWLRRPEIDDRASLPSAGAAVKKAPC
jgi:ferredoxin